MHVISHDLLDEIVRRLVIEFAPDSIFLFGSHAWGAPGEDSDIDLLVVVPHSDERPTRRAALAHRCLRGIAAPMDILVKTRDEVDAVAGVSTSLETQILERGKVLYERGSAGECAPMAPQGVA